MKNRKCKHHNTILLLKKWGHNILYSINNHNNLSQWTSAKNSAISPNASIAWLITKNADE